MNSGTRSQNEGSIPSAELIIAIHVCLATLFEASFISCISWTILGSLEQSAIFIRDFEKAMAVQTHQAAQEKQACCSNSAERALL